MSFKPTEEMKAAYCYVRDHRPHHESYDNLADLALHATAAAMELEYWKDRYALRVSECKKKYGFNYKIITERTEADWLRLADEKLRGLNY